MGGKVELKPSVLRYSGLSSPRSLPGLAGWYDFSIPAVLFQQPGRCEPVTAPGQPIGYVLDLSGRGYPLRQADADAKPVFLAAAAGMPACARFGGENAGLSCRGLRGITTAAVVYRAEGKADEARSLFTAPESSAWQHVLLGCGGAQNGWRKAGGTQAGHAAFDGKWHINLYRVLPNACQFQVRMDGMLDLFCTFSGDWKSEMLESIGWCRKAAGGGFFRGVIGEVVLYTRQLSLESCRRLERWLAYQWPVVLRERGG